MNRIEQRLKKLENATGDHEPIEFVLRFVSTDGTPDRVCRLTMEGLIDIEEGEHDERN